ncbi:MAG TPA: GreA/GreB family elongation factor [bacterium]|nr:GreA/GreB family elongation factor [bacterium]HPV65289.1 GreA/GreB family elongation factor [bacterium]
MRVPIRRSDKVPTEKIDTKITLEKYRSLSKTLEKLKNEIRPKESEEVKILSTTGDYSENAGYQAAKAKLRRTNNKISKIEYILNRADIIETNPKSDEVQIGSLVKLEIDGKIKKYQILGSAETDPSKGKISYISPLGSSLLGKKIGEFVSINNLKKYKIVEIK